MRESVALDAFRKYGDTVLRAAYACCGSYTEAEDITQDVFLMLHSKPCSFKDDEHMKAWLLRVTINKCKNLRKAFRISHTQSLDSVSDSHGAYSLDTSEIEMRDLIARLPKKYSSVIYLYYYEGYSTSEIAEMLGKNVNTVSSLLRRGREKLKLELTMTEEDAK